MSRFEFEKKFLGRKYSNLVIDKEQEHIFEGLCEPIHYDKDEHSLNSLNSLKELPELTQCSECSDYSDYSTPCSPYYPERRNSV